eukprot:gene10811-3429_t
MKSTSDVESLVKKILTIGFLQMFDTFPVYTINKDVIDEKKYNKQYCQRVFKDSVRVKGIIETICSLDKERLVTLRNTITTKKTHECIVDILDEIVICGMLKLLNELNQEELYMIAENLNTTQNEIDVDIILSQLKELQRAQDFYFY